MSRIAVRSFVVVVLIAVAASAVRPGSDPITRWRRWLRSEKAKPVPKAVVEGDLIHEFGTMLQKAQGEWRWLVRNEGETELELWMESSSYAFSRRLKGGRKVLVKPGDSTEIDLEWKTGSAIGNIKKVMSIGTNDPKLGSFVLGVHGRIEPPAIPPQAEATTKSGPA
jgi:hypothetical protein